VDAILKGEDEQFDDGAFPLHHLWVDFAQSRSSRVRCANFFTWARRKSSVLASGHEKTLVGLTVLFTSSFASSTAPRVEAVASFAWVQGISMHCPTSCGIIIEQYFHIRSTTLTCDYDAYILRRRTRYENISAPPLREPCGFATKCSRQLRQLA
jgi:hypothetical protein